MAKIKKHKQMTVTEVIVDYVDPIGDLQKLTETFQYYLSKFTAQGYTDIRLEGHGYDEQYYDIVGTRPFTEKEKEKYKAEKQKETEKKLALERAQFERAKKEYEALRAKFEVH